MRAQGKIYRCHVYEIASGKVTHDNRTGGTIYLNAAVPGGIVKAEFASAAGTPVIMSMTRFTTARRRSPGADHALTTQPADMHWQTSFGPFGFEVPQGWTAVSPDREKTKAMLVLHGTAPDPSGILKIDVGMPAFPTPEALARAMAGQDGHVDAEPIDVDGAKGTRVDIPSEDMLRPRSVVVIYRGGRVYLIMGAHAHGADISEAFNEVLKTWKWDVVLPVQP